MNCTLLSPITITNCTPLSPNYYYLLYSVHGELYNRVYKWFHGQT